MLQAQIYIDKDEMYQDKYLHTFIMEFLIQHDISGATAINGFMGFGKNQKMKHPNRLFSFDEQPMVITFIDEEAKVRKALIEIKKLVPNGMVIANKVEVFK